MRRAVAPKPQAAEAQPPEEGVLPHCVHLQASAPLDATLQVRDHRWGGARGQAPRSATAAATRLLLVPLPPPSTLSCSPLPCQTASRAAPLLAWHPTKQRLLAASGGAVVEYDAISGARRSLVEAAGSPLRLVYTPGGASVVMLTRVGFRCCRCPCCWYLDGRGVIQLNAELTACWLTCAHRSRSASSSFAGARRLPVERGGRLAPPRAAAARPQARGEEAGRGAHGRLGGELAAASIERHL